MSRPMSMLGFFDTDFGMYYEFVHYLLFWQFLAADFGSTAVNFINVLRARFSYEILAPKPKRN